MCGLSTWKFFAEKFPADSRRLYAELRKNDKFCEAKFIVKNQKQKTRGLLSKPRVKSLFGYFLEQEYTVIKASERKAPTTDHAIDPPIPTVTSIRFKSAKTSPKKKHPTAIKAEIQEIILLEK